MVQNVPGLRRTLARWVGRAAAEAGAGVAAALASGLMQSVVGPVVGFAYHSLRLGELRARQAARLGREAFGSHLSRHLGQRGIVVLRPGSLRLLDQIDVVVVEGRLWSGEEAARLQRVAMANDLGVVLVGAPPRRGRRSGEGDVIPHVSVADGEREVRRLQIAGRVVATVGGPSFAPLPAGDLPIGIAGPEGRAPDGSHVICLDGLSDATRVLGACLPARQASRESAQLSLVGAVAGALLAMTPAVGPRRLPRVLTAIDSAALVAVGNAVRHARRAEGGGAEPSPEEAADLPAPVPVSELARCDNGQEAALT